MSGSGFARTTGGVAARAFLLALACSMSAVVFGAPPAAGVEDQRNPLRIPPPEERDAFLKDEHLLEPGAPWSPSSTPGAFAAGVNALDYRLELTFDSASTTVSGSVTGTFEVVSPGLSTLVENLYDNMTVSSVTLGGSPLAFTRGSNKVTITLDRPYAAGETLEVKVTYSGTPQRLGFGSFTWSSHNGAPIFCSLSEPTYGPTWWPSVDDPSDKTIAEMIFTVEPGLVAVSNGVLLDVSTGSNGWVTYHWRESLPIAGYLISIAASNYDTYADTYTPVAGGDPMEIRYWVYPELYAASQVVFADTPDILATYASLFGEYPFLPEKYGLALFTFSGGMEHQTATSFGAALVNGTTQYEYLLAHETAHQWWGDSLTLTSWSNTWLHEGFATYAEALYYGARDGEAAYHDYMAYLVRPTFNGPVHGNPNAFSITVYYKGAWVLHMLRHILGDASFFDMLRSYHQSNQFGNVNTPVFQAAAESAWGRDLSWFFDEWVYSSTDRPTYQWGWTAADTGSGWVVHLRIDQTQSGTIYRMPLDVRVSNLSGDTTTVVWTDPTTHDFTIAVPDEPSFVRIDPDDWVLNRETIVSLPDADLDGVYDGVDNCAAIANPAQGDADSDGIGDACDLDADDDGVENGFDCAWLDAGSFAPPEEVDGVDWPALDLLTWNDQAAKIGPAVQYDLIRGDAGGLPGVRTEDAACLLQDITSTSASDPAVPALEAAYFYLIRTRNACGVSGYGSDSAGIPRLNTACP